jgi:hypothetical protein
MTEKSWLIPGMRRDKILLFSQLPDLLWFFFSAGGKAAVE